MGNLGSRKKQKEDEIAEDVWMKLNDGQPSPKNKKKKKKKRKKKGKRDSPDRFDENTSQCDSYSQSTLSSRKLSDSTIASTGTITHHNVENETKPISNIGTYQTDDQSNCSIGYVTASDTFTPPSPRKGRQSKFSPVIAQDSPRVVRRLLQSEKILENKEESPENLSPRARFFLSTPETSKTSKAFENKKYYRHSSGSSIDSRTFLGIPDEKLQQSLSASGNDNRYVTNGSLIVKSRQQENTNSYGHDRRFSYNNEMSDSTTENLVKTGEKAKLIRYDNGNMSPAERRKNKQNDALRVASNDDHSTNKLPFVKYDREHPTCGVRDDFIDFIITKDCESEALPSVKIEMQNDNEMTQKVNQETHLRVQGSQLEIVPPPSPASGVSLIEIDESDITESESCSDKHLSKDDEHFGDSVCKRLSLLLESEQDKAKLNRSEFNEFTDSHCSSPEIQDIAWEDEAFNEQVNGECEQICDKHLNYKDAQESKLDCNAINTWDSNDGMACKSMHEAVSQDSKLEISCNEGSSFNSTVKTPQGQDNASVLDVMNNNFRMKTTDNIMVKEAAQKVDCALAFENYGINKKFREKEYSKQDQDIEEQMRYENEINEKLIEERFKTLNEILPPQKEENKRHSWLCAINNKHANDPDNYILVTKKTFCVKRGILVELLDEEKDVITRDVTKIIDDKSDWITTGSEQMYRPDSMIVEQGRKLVCSKFDDNKCLTESDISDSVSEPDYVNMDDFERQERKCYHNISPSDEEIDFENVLNRSQSQSDSECSDMRPKRESDILCDVIDAYKDDDFSEYSDEVSDEDNPYIKEPRKIAHRTKLSKCIQYSDEMSEDEMLYVDEPRTQNRKRPSKHIQHFDEMSDDEILSDEESKAEIKKKLLKETGYSDELSEDEILYGDQPRTENMKKLSKRTRHSNEISDDKILYVGESIGQRKNMPLKYSDYSDEISGDEILYADEPRVENRKQSSKHIQYSDEISEDEISEDEILYVEEPITLNRKIMTKCTHYSDEISEDEMLYVDAPITQNMPKMSKRTQYSDEISDDEILYVEEQQTQKRKRLSKHRQYSDDLSDDEILYDDTPQSTSRKISSKVVRIPSKLDQSLQKIFQEKQKQLALSEQEKVDNLDDFEISATAEVYDQFQAAGYDSPHQKSSEGSRRSLAYTESDLDASEKWDDDDNASNDSMLADDEYDDDEIGEIIFSKPYIEHEEKADAMFSYNMVKTLPESPVVWEPEADDDDDVFQDTPKENSGYHQHAEDSIDSSDEAFDDARKQMQEIHEQLQTLREQMVTFENEEEESSVPPSPLDDRILNIQKASSD